MIRMKSMHHMEKGSFMSGWDPFLLLITLLLAGLYLYTTGVGKLKRNETFSVCRLKKISFLLGVLLLFIAKGSPLNQMGHSLFLIHMLQQSILYMAVPPLILGGLSLGMVKAIELKLPRWISKSFTLLAKPLIAIILFNALFSFYHIPFIFDAIMSNMVWMNLSVMILFPAALLMWWPVLSPVKMNELKPLYKVAYIFGMGMLLTPACALIIFSKEILYDTYLEMPRLYGISLLDDQQSGGIVMKVMQEVIYAIALAIIFFQWTRSEKNKTREEDRVRLERSGSY